MRGYDHRSGWLDFGRCYVIAWLLYAGLVLGPIVRQFITRGNIEYNGCFRAFFINPMSCLAAAGIGLVVAFLMFCGFRFRSPRALVSRDVIRVGAVVFFAALFFTALLTTGDLATEVPCV